MIQAVRGMNDILPDKSPYWQFLETCCRTVAANYGYSEIRMPTVESTALFKRSIGEATDIVEKEMYTFDDRNGDSLTLRPEGTAGCVRAAIQHGLLHNQIQRLWYLGPMFRHERPQKGRYRQFYQFGVEAYGMAGPEIEAEVILLSQRLLKEIGLGDKVTLEINTLGNSSSRQIYRQALVDYLSEREDQLDSDSKRRLQSNPLRILDSKNPQMQELIEAAPKLIDYLDDESREQFDRLCAILKAVNVPFKLNPRLVRGLDYYSHTVFEWVTSELGAQGTVLAGGRYDSLVELLGGKPTPAVGFACGLERLVLLLEANKQCSDSPDAYMVLTNEAIDFGLQVAEQIRTELPAFKLMLNLSGGGFKAQFKRADKSGARFALVIGGEEAENAEVTLKDLRGELPQTKYSTAALIELLKNEGE